MTRRYKVNWKTLDIFHVKVKKSKEDETKKRILIYNNMYEELSLLKTFEKVKDIMVSDYTDEGGGHVILAKLKKNKYLYIGATIFIIKTKASISHFRGDMDEIGDHVSYAIDNERNIYLFPTGTVLTGDGRVVRDIIGCEFENSNDIIQLVHEFHHISRPAHCDTRMWDVMKLTDITEFYSKGERDDMFFDFDPAAMYEAQKPCSYVQNEERKEMSMHEYVTIMTEHGTKYGLEKQNIEEVYDFMKDRNMRG